MRVSAFIFLFLISFRLYAANFFIENEALVHDGTVDKYVEKIMREHQYVGDRIYIIGFKRDKEKDKIIKEYFGEKRFRYGFFMKLYLLFNKKSVVYASSAALIKYLDEWKYKYVNVVYDLASVSSEDVLSLRNSKRRKILFTQAVRKNLYIRTEKDKIIVIDGDTFNYNNIRYRLLGIDAPEIIQTPYGEHASNFVYTKIKNAKDVVFRTADIDIYNRILTHIIIDGKPLSFMLMEEKLAIQTVTTYGDNGYPEIASGIIERAKKQGRLKFKSPAVFRREQRKRLSLNNSKDLDSSKSLIENSPSSKQKTPSPKKTGRPKKVQTNEMISNPIDVYKTQSENVFYAPPVGCEQIEKLIKTLKENGFTLIDDTTEKTNFKASGNYFDGINNIDIEKTEMTDNVFICVCHSYTLEVIYSADENTDNKI